jgi:hypothetical protein
VLSIKLPLREKPQVTSIKLPLKENVWLLIGFVLSERIIELKTKETTILENVKSRILFDISIVDKNHLKITWEGESVPKLLIYKKRVEEEWSKEPEVELDWDLHSYILEIDSNSYDFKVLGKNDSGESGVISIGNYQNYNMDFSIDLPINQKIYYFDLSLTSEFRFEVNL